MKRILFVAAAAMMLAGCPSFQQDRPKTPPPVVPVEPTEPTEPTTPPQSIRCLHHLSKKPQIGLLLSRL